MRALLATFFFAASALGQTTITSIYPASGPTSGGTFVHILGTDLIGLPLACPALDCGNYLRFGDALGVITINNSTEIVAVAPPNPAGTVDVTVNIAGKAKITILAAFRYEAPGSDFEQILLPLVGELRPGAFGSVWKTEVILHNASTEDIPLRGANCNPVLLVPCVPFHLPGSATETPTIFNAPDFSGSFLSVPRAHTRDVDISIRVQDTSRQAQTLGTTIPVVWATDFQRIARLNGVPTDSRFRTTLRVYGYDGASPITLRIFDPSSSQPLVDTRLDLRQPFQNDPTYPPYLQIDGLADAFPAIRGHGVVRVEVASDFIPPKPLWAFVSVTNNETQHVTVIAPSPTASP